MTVVVLDGAGGDYAPGSTVEGAVIAARTGVEVALTGDAEVLGRELARLGGAPPGVKVVHAPDTIEMHEHSMREVRNRRQSSIYVGMELVRDGEADAFVSLGNTGAVLTLAFVVLGRLRGVERPALGALLPARDRPALLLDAGANAEARVSHLVQFAQLGAAYMRGVRGVAEPAVGLLNLGEEAEKGSPFTIEAHAALSIAPGLHVAGNVEGRDLLAGLADVIVTDGVTGNVALKGLEGAVTVVRGEVREAARSSLIASVGGLLLRGAVSDARQRLDYRRQGSTPLLGVDGVVMVGHGSSNAETVASAVGSAAEAVESGMLDALRAAVPGSEEAASEGAPSR